MSYFLLLRPGGLEEVFFLSLDSPPGLCFEVEPGPRDDPGQGIGGWFVARAILSGTRRAMVVLAIARYATCLPNFVLHLGTVGRKISRWPGYNRLHAIHMRHC